MNNHDKFITITKLIRDNNGKILCVYRTSVPKLDTIENLLWKECSLKKVSKIKRQETMGNLNQLLG